MPPAHLEGPFERIGQHGELRSSVVLSTRFDGRPVAPPVGDNPVATRAEGWTT